MVYKEYDNAELFESNIPCLGIDLMKRNQKRYNIQHEEGNIRNFSSTSQGNYQEISSQTLSSAYDIYAIGMGDYLYYTNESEPGVVDLVEHQISTNTEKSINAWHYDVSAYEITYFHMSYLEPHKIIIQPEDNYSSSNVWILDFTAMTKTLEISTDFYWTHMLYVKEIGEKTWIFLIGEGDADGLTEYHKNYTDAGSWGSSSYLPDEFFDEEADIDEDYSVIGNYIVMCMNVDQNHSAPYTPNAHVKAISFNMSTLAWQTSNTLYTEGWGYDSRWLVISGVYSTGDISTGKIYGETTGYGDYFGGVFSHAVKFIFEYDPVTNTATTLRSDGYETKSGTLSIDPMTTYEHAYMTEADTGNTYLMPSLDVVSSTNWNQYQYTLIDNGNIVYKDSESAGVHKISAIDFDGNVIQEWVLPEGYALYYIIAAGQGLLAIASTLSGPWTEILYLLT